MKSPLINELVLPTLRSSWATGALAAGINLIGGIAGSSSANWNSVYQQRLQQTYNEMNAKQQQQYNLELLAQQLANSKELWKLENAYQTPAMQVARLLEAGGNPAALFGLGNGSSASAHAQLPSTPSAGLPSAGFGHGVGPDLSGVGSALIAGIQADADKNLKDALADKTREETESILPVMKNMYDAMTRNYDEQSGLAEAQSIYQKTINSIAERSADEQVEGYRLRNDLTLAEINRTIQDTQKTILESEDLKWKVQMMNPMEYQQATQDLKYTAAAIALAYAEKALTDKNVEFTHQGLQNLILENVGMRLDNSMRRLEYQYERDTYDTRVELAKTQGKIAEREYKWLPWKNLAAIATGAGMMAVGFYTKGASTRARAAGRSAALRQ